MICCLKYFDRLVVHLKSRIFHLNSAFLICPLSFGMRSVTHEVDALFFLNEDFIEAKD